MTIQDYFEALIGQFLEVAGTDAKNQCVDSVNFYIKFVLRKPIIEYTNARDFPSKVSKDDYDWIPNEATNHPIEGDIVVWGGNVWGHIGVCFSNDADAIKFRSFDQNWPTYSSCRVVDHSYTNVLGWLRPKNVPVSLDSELQKCVTDRNAHWDFIIQIATKLGIETSLPLILAEIEKLITYEDKVIEYEKQLNEVKISAQKMGTELEEKAKLLDEERKQNETLTHSVEASQLRIETLAKAVEEAQKSIKELQGNCNPVVTFKGWKLKIYNWLLRK